MHSLLLGSKLRGQDEEEEGKAEASPDQEGEVRMQERARFQNQVQVDPVGRRGHQQVRRQGRYSVLS